eukprot:gene8057-5800_t
MSKLGESANVALVQQIDELRERMRALQNDRKANIDLVESNKNTNKEEIRKLRDENKELRKKLAHLSKTALNEESKNELKHIEKRVDGLRRQYDELRNIGTRQRKQLDGLKDEVKDLELDSQKPHMEDNEYTRRIRALENKLDKAMIQYNEAQSIRKTYEQILQRLSEERVGFDNQLTAIERALSAKQRDYEELVLLTGDANHARDTALQELERVRAVYEEERRKREKELREQHQSIALRRSMLERMQQREKLRQALATPGISQSQAAENELRQSQAAKAAMLEKIESRNKVNIFENAFRKIKEATGVSDVNEVIQKIISQETTTENLIHVTRENQSKIEALQELKKKIKLHCEELKYNAVGGGQHRKMVDSYEDQLSTAATRLERSRLKYERLSKVVIAMKAGVGHLQDKLEGFRNDVVKGQSFVISDETVADALHESDLCFETMLKRILAGEEEMKRIMLLDSSAAQGAAGAATLPKTKGPGLVSDAMDDEDAVHEMSLLRPFNQRIDLATLEADLPHSAGGATAGHASAGGMSAFLTGGFETAATTGAFDEDNDMDEDLLTRDKVKRASRQILDSMTKQSKKGRKKGGGGGGGGHHGDHGAD